MYLKQRDSNELIINGNTSNGNTFQMIKSYAGCISMTEILSTNIALIINNSHQLKLKNLEI